MDSEVGSSYGTIMDSRTSSHYLSVYDVPYDTENNAGMSWRYSLERLASPQARNSHIVQVTSTATSREQELEVLVRTNTLQHEVHISLEHPFILYVEVRQGGMPVSGCRVLCDLQPVDSRTGKVGPTATLELRDNGAGDPDIEAGDGVYSKYVTRLMGPGLYRMKVQVLSNVEFPAHVKLPGGEEQLGPFSRIVKGHSFRAASVAPHYSARLPPCRILDLSVSVVTASQQLEFRWSAPGADYDEGRPTSYQLYQTGDADQFSAAPLPASALLVESFSAVRAAGGSEVHRVTVSQGQVSHFFFVLLKKGKTKCLTM